MKQGLTLQRTQEFLIIYLRLLLDFFFSCIQCLFLQNCNKSRWLLWEECLLKVHPIEVATLRSSSSLPDKKPAAAWICRVHCTSVIIVLHTSNTQKGPMIFDLSWDCSTVLSVEALSLNLPSPPTPLFSPSKVSKQDYLMSRPPRVFHTFGGWWRTKISHLDLDTLSWKAERWKEGSIRAKTEKLRVKAFFPLVGSQKISRGQWTALVIRGYAQKMGRLRQTRSWKRPIYSSSRK